MGIEPTCEAWKASVLPLNYTRTGFQNCNDPQGIVNLAKSRQRRAMLIIQRILGAYGPHDEMCSTVASRPWRPEAPAPRPFAPRQPATCHGSLSEAFGSRRMAQWPAFPVVPSHRVALGCTQLHQVALILKCV